ncbi:hypothetical protein [Streptomyces sp. ISL-100]|uniref:hypothetical protein n=1 Tax=Streptomyces sp. ISL-100 TaxID=2819173 RepID=UPI001BEC484F|nr:hypothetical protein [Streptomyces sp. ISL-100]MBT2401579.1 hypothetical protein [Streptomyces sp. ISL-100]
MGKKDKTEKKAAKMEKRRAKARQLHTQYQALTALSTVVEQKRRVLRDRIQVAEARMRVPATPGGVVLSEGRTGRVSPNGKRQRVQFVTGAQSGQDNPPRG